MLPAVRARWGARSAGALAVWPRRSPPAAAGRGGATTCRELPSDDPRVGLAPGLDNAGDRRARHGAPRAPGKPPGWSNPNNPGDFAFPNSDLAFQGDYAFVGSFNGFKIYDISNPSSPTLRRRWSAPAARATCRSTATCCSCRSRRPARGRTARWTRRPTRRRASAACGSSTSATSPRRAGAAGADVPRLAHAHAGDRRAGPGQRLRLRPGHRRRAAGDRARRLRGDAGAAELEKETPQPENSSRWRIEVIKVPVAAPETAAVVSEPRLFSDGTRINGLQNTPRTPTHPSGTRGARARSRTPATTSRSTRRSTWRPAPARATAC